MILRTTCLLLALVWNVTHADDPTRQVLQGVTVLDRYFALLKSSFGERSAILREEREKLLFQGGPLASRTRIRDSFFHTLRRLSYQLEDKTALVKFIQESKDLFVELINGTDDALKGLASLSGKAKPSFSESDWTASQVVFFQTHEELFAMPIREAFQATYQVFSASHFPGDANFHKDAEIEFRRQLPKLAGQAVTETSPEKLLRELLKDLNQKRGELISIGFAFAAGRYARKHLQNDAAIFDAAKLLQPNLMSLPFIIKHRRKHYRINAAELLWATFLFGASPDDLSQCRASWNRNVFAHLPVASTNLGLIARLTVEDVSPAKHAEVPSEQIRYIEGSHVSHLLQEHVTADDRANLLLQTDNPSIHHLAIKSAQAAINHGVPLAAMLPEANRPEAWRKIFLAAGPLAWSWEEIREAFRQTLDSAPDGTVFATLLIAASDWHQVEKIATAATRENEVRLATTLSPFDWSRSSRSNMMNADEIFQIGPFRFFSSTLLRFVRDTERFQTPVEIEKYAEELGKRVGENREVDESLYELVVQLNQLPLPESRRQFERALAQYPEWKEFLLWKLSAWYDATQEEDWAPMLIKEVQTGLAMGNMGIGGVKELFFELFERLALGESGNLPYPTDILAISGAALSMLTQENDEAIERIRSIVQRAEKHGRWPFERAERVFEVVSGLYQMPPAFPVWIPDPPQVKSRVKAFLGDCLKRLGTAIPGKPQLEAKDGARDLSASSP